MKNLRKLLLGICAGTIVFSFCPQAYCLSTTTRLVSTNISYAPLKIEAQIVEGKAHYVIQVKFDSKAEASASLSGKLEIFQAGQLLISHSISAVRPAGPFRDMLEAGKAERPALFKFEVPREYLQQSKFTITFDHPDFHRGDTYWFCLSDFMKER